LSLETTQAIPLEFPCVLTEDVVFSSDGEGGRQDHWVKLDAGTEVCIDPASAWEVQASVSDFGRLRRFKYVGFGSSAEFIEC
jgi:hypothetical protein